MLLLVAFCLCLVGTLASPVRRGKVETNEVKLSPKLVEGERQWERVNEKVIPKHLEGVRLERDGEFNKVLLLYSKFTRS